jgi:Protein of unknown function (DUF2637)
MTGSPHRDMTRPSSFRLVRLALVVLTSGVAAVTFTISFHGLNGFGVDVMRLDRLSPLVPVGVDLASLVALLAAHMRREELWRRRAYAWLVFVVTSGLSVAGNLADGFARGLVPAGLVGVACAPVVFVLVSHLAITSWRGVASTAAVRPVTSSPGTEPPVTQPTRWQPAPLPAPASGDDSAAEQPPLTPDEEPAAAAEAAPAVAVAVPVTPVKPVAGGRGTKRQPSAAERVAKAIARSPRASDATIAARLGLSEATVRRHRRQAVDSVSTPADGAALAA